MKNQFIKTGIESLGMSKPLSAYPEISAEDRAYLTDLAKATWQCIAYYVNPDTGLPYDTSEKAEYSSVTNLGYFVASCAVASKMDLISHQAAVQRVRKVLDGYEKFKKWRGWSQSWNSVETFKPAPHDTAVSLLDSGNMVSGFLVAAQALPEVRDQVNRIVSALDWSAVYDPKEKLLWGGYNMEQQKTHS